MLHIERRGAVGLWTIDRPEAKNALNQAMFKALREAVEAARADTTLRAVVLTSAGRNVHLSPRLGSTAQQLFELLQRRTPGESDPKDISDAVRSPEYPG